MTTTPELLRRDAQPAPLAESSPWESLEAVLLAHCHDPDLEAVRVLFSAVAAHRLPGQPVWLMLVAPPGSMKTELLEALGGLPNVHLVDRLTPNSFLSGQVARARAPASLLHRIGPDGILVFPDFSTILGMHRDHRAAVLADLRRIFDGHLRRELGTAEHPAEREWRGRLTFLVAATPDVDRHYSIFQTLGERFVMVRWHRPGGTEAALRAMGQDRQRVRQELRNAVTALFGSLPEQQPALPEELGRRIAALAEFVVVARTHVSRDGRTKYVIYVPEPEAPTRLAQQLGQLAKGSALLAGRQTVTDEDVAIVQRAGTDCIPATRRRIIEVLMRGKHRSAIMLASALKMPWSTYHYAMMDLKSLGLVDSSYDHEEGETVQWLTRPARRLLREAGVRTRRGRVVRRDSVVLGG